MHFISPWHGCPWAVTVRTALPSLDGKSSDPFQHLQCLSMWVKTAREIHLGRGELKYNLFFRMSNARSFERREKIIDLLSMHILRHLFQDIHCRWDAGAAEPLDCHPVARLMLSGKSQGWKGKWRLRHFRSNHIEGSATCLAGWRTRWCSSVREKKGDFRCLLPPEASCFPSCTRPAAFSLECCLKQSLSLAVSFGVVPCCCSLSLGFEWAQALCHLEVSLRSEVAALTAIRGSAEPPQLLPLPYAAWLEHPEVLQGCEETPEDESPCRGAALPCGAGEVLPKFNNCSLTNTACA